MKAAVLEKTRKPLALMEIEEPKAVPGSVVLKVEAEGICRTDWHVWNGDWGWVGMSPELPLVMGHEFGGTVVEVGEGVNSVRVGDRVTTPFHEACGRCSYCLVGRSNLCDDLEFIGLTHSGGYAEYTEIRNADFNCIQLPDNVDALSAAAIGCRYMTAFHAVTRQGRMEPGDWVVVYGAGGVGLSAVQIASSLGGQVIAVDLADDKLAKATAEGAAHTINAGSHDAPAAVCELTGGGANVAIGGLGSQVVVDAALMSLRKGGRLAQVGLTSQAEQGRVSIPIDHIIETEIELVGSVGNPHSDYPRLLNLVRRGILQPARIVGQQLGLQEVQGVLDAMDTFETVGFSVITEF
jgi:propanol-preferring alcohol dehydrogenase